MLLDTSRKFLLLVTTEEVVVFLLEPFLLLFEVGDLLLVGFVLLIRSLLLCFETFELVRCRCVTRMGRVEGRELEAMFVDVGRKSSARLVVTSVVRFVMSEEIGQSSMICRDRLQPELGRHD
jgi:hypothetical protein